MSPELATGGPRRSRRAPALGVGVAGAVVAMVAVVVFLVWSAVLGGGAGDDAASTTPPSEETATDPTGGDTEGVATPNGDRSSEGSTPTSVEATDVGGVGVTVEADENPAPDEPGAETPDPQTPPGQNPPATVPTAPAPTSGTCRVPMADLAGSAGPIELDPTGACGSVGATIVAVNPRDDLADVDWGRDLRVCQRHPAATDVLVTLISAAGPVPVDQGLNRTPDEGAADPVVAIEIRFDRAETPETGPRPILVCRTSEAELSIVHRPSP